MLDIVRDSTLGQLINIASNGRLLPYADQRPDYVIPAKFLAPSVASPAPSFPRTDTGARTLVENEPAPMVVDDVEKAASADLNKPSQPQPEPEKYQYLVEFEENDPDRPHVYLGSAVYTAAIPGIMAEFNVSLVVATLGLSLFVFAYGFGPMLLAPMQEMPSIGRNPPYMVGLFLFVIFQIPIVLARKVSVILVFRFLSGFVGSPALATGGASMGDIFSPKALPAAIGIWSMGAVCGPIAGPVIGGFAAQANGWKWPNLELLWMTGFALAVLLVLLPETYEPTILVRRAERLRKLTGNKLIKAQAELDAKVGEGFFSIIGGRMKKAVQLSLEPAVLFSNVYIGLVYSIFYLWFEAFPLVFNNIYGFNLGIGGLPYLAFIVSGALTFTVYLWYQKKILLPRAINDPKFRPEDRLELALFAAVFIPVSLFLFGWSARPSVHWIVPIIGAGLYLPGIFLAFQCIIMYIVTGYPLYAASILAGNALFRSELAGGFPLFGHKFYTTLGVGGGCSLLAGLSILMMVPLYGLYKYGDRLRARSKWTTP
ncbi:hypothetical protein OIO90_000679 [Microbotryomycetes sp. JL221]|nr:hypothetical protein OIO90_000679 [Microbotryomycetes sp. JL221]